MSSDDGSSASASGASAAASSSAPAQNQPLARNDQHDAPDRPVSAITFRLPQYWPGDPQLWFAQAEAHFANHRITNPRAKYNVVVSSLAPEYAAEIRDLLLAPPAEEPYYQVLKEALTARTQKSDQARLRELLSTADIGDSRPSRVLRRMQQLLGSKSLDPTILRELFVQRLPVTVRLILAATPASLSLDELAALADKVVESTCSTPLTGTSVHALSEAPSPARSSTALSCRSTASTDAEQACTADRAEMAQLRAELAKLTSAVNVMTRDTGAPCQRGRQRERSPGPPSRHPSASRSPGRDNHDDLCWYHRAFGAKANKCRDPCRFLSGNGKASH